MGVKRHNIELGRWGERLAETHLVESGAKILARNYRSAPGEIDLIMEDDGELVAVEVKTRTDLDLEQPEEAVTRWKLLRMARGLQTYAINNDLEDRPMRLDVVAVVLNLDGSVQRLTHLRSVYTG
jgi:putative endonuclease